MFCTLSCRTSIFKILSDYRITAFEYFFVCVAPCSGYLKIDLSNGKLSLFGGGWIKPISLGILRSMIICVTVYNTQD